MQQPNSSTKLKGNQSHQKAKNDELDHIEDVASPQDHNNSYEFGDDESAVRPDDIRERDIEMKIANAMDDGKFAKAYDLLKDLEQINDSKPVCT